MATSTIKMNSIRQYKSTNGFDKLGLNQYVKNVCNALLSGISGYSSGVFDLTSTTGPRYTVVLGKTNDNYWTALIHTYAESDVNLYRIAYANGTIMATIIGY